MSSVRNLTSPAKRKNEHMFWLLPDSFQVLFFQNRRSALIATACLYLMVLGTFAAIFVGNYNAVTKSSFLSATGSSWSSTCEAREPVSQEFLLTDTGYWSNEKKFEYHHALLSFTIPQGYQQGGDGFERALDQFAIVLSELANDSVTMDWVSQLSLMSSKKWIHEDTGIVMRYLADPENILQFPSSGESTYQISFQDTANMSSTTCGSPMMSINGAYATITWYNTADACTMFGNLSETSSFFSFKVDVRSSMIAAAINAGLMNYTDLGEVMAYDPHSMAERMLRCDPHYPGMQVLNCETFVPGVCFLEVYQNGWYHILPSVYHECEWMPEMCGNKTCSCTIENDTMNDMCMYNAFVVQFQVFSDSGNQTDYFMTMHYNADFNFALNEYSYMPMFDHCGSDTLVPQAMFNAVRSKTLDTGAMETYYECKRTVAYGFIYGLSTSLSVVSGIYALMLIVLPSMLQRAGFVHYVYRDIQGHLAESFVGGAPAPFDGKKKDELQGVKGSYRSEEEVELPLHGHES
eukprot:TRINITY_DN2056_c0_g1_i1.p1 TRINITY_DN2056_c0_g1~~TRINITY_DN2056_c0_g1_i1.p1  ORF type:complete len:520 (-),score=85.11 TRINITY_DN2056_c0_g1_i1:47-1606(-)